MTKQEYLTRLDRQIKNGFSLITRTDHLKDADGDPVYDAAKGSRLQRRMDSGKWRVVALEEPKGVNPEQEKPTAPEEPQPEPETPKAEAKKPVKRPPRPPSRKTSKK